MAQYDINKIQLPNGDICNIKGDISDCYTKNEADELFVGCQTRVDDVQVTNNPLRVPVEDISSLYTINKTSGNANPLSVVAYRVGQMIQMQINLRYTASTNAGSDIFNGSLVGGPLPVTNMTVCSGYQGACTATLNIYSNGGIVIRASGSGSIGSNGNDGAYRIVFLTSDESTTGSIVEEETYATKNYTLGEEATGDTWIDGKPIYRYVVSTSLTNKTGGQVLGYLPHTPETFIRAYGSFSYSDWAAPRNLPYGGAGTANTFVEPYILASDGTVRVLVGTALTKTVTYHVVVEYTLAN